MRWLAQKVSVLWLYPVGVFAAICLTPWWDISKSPGEYSKIVPLATAYANQFQGWQCLLLLHLAATIVLSFTAIGLHFGIARLMKARRPEISSDALRK
jgi:hypothetical protein